MPPSAHLQQQHASVDGSVTAEKASSTPENNSATATNNNLDGVLYSNSNNNSALYNSNPGGPGFMSSPFYGNAFGGGMYGLGAGMYGGAGGMYGGMMGGGGGGPVSSLNQFLFGIQNVIFSLSQAVQIIGMNTEAVKHLLESATVMFDHAVATWRELHALEAEQRQTETPEARKRRRRLRALRWALLVGVSYAGYQLVRKLVGATANALLRQQPQRRPLPAQAASESSSSSLLLQAPHYPPTASATVANSRFFF